MSDLLKKIRDGFDSFLIDRFFSFMLSLVTTILVGSGINSGSLESLTTEYNDLVILIAVFIFTYALSTIIHSKPHKFKFRIRSLEIFYEYQGDSVTVYQKTTVRPTFFPQTEMYHKKYWFSDEPFEFVSMTDGFSVVHTHSVGNEHEFFVRFPRKIHFWESVTFETKFCGENIHRKHKNFYCYEVICPIDKLTIDISIPHEYTTRQAKLKTFYVHEQSKGASTQPIKFNNHYTWNIPHKPKLGWSYMFEWGWAKHERKKVKSSTKK